MNKIIKPRCGECIHLKEDAHTLWCDIPNGNRKASKDVGGCDNFETK